MHAVLHVSATKLNVLRVWMFILSISYIVKKKKKLLPSI